MIGGVRAATKIIRKFNPQVVVGFGGYAAFAGVLAGRMSGRLTAIHEQNAFPGLTNRILGKRVDRIFLSMPDVGKVFPKGKALMVGNPVRSGIMVLYEQRQGMLRSPLGAEGHAETGQGSTPDPELAELGTVAGAIDAAVSLGEHYRPRQRPPRLLVMGGSLGAKALNQGMLASFPALLAADIEVWHQTGQADYEEVRLKYRESGAVHVRVEPFINDMARAYSWADLALCRAGGSSVAELTSAGLPAILVPFPFAAQDHQRYNARFLTSEGAAVTLEQDKFFGAQGNPTLLTETILEIVRDESTLEQMSRRSLSLAKPYAAREMVDELEQMPARKTK
jgi:UDP-N-acetylglucosamine--N-acetylmuramyl-(pentapeptide) pyrophosphoryl-undecaprenol N-acetylglucosamine transferase